MEVTTSEMVWRFSTTRRRPPFWRRDTVRDAFPAPVCDHRTSYFNDMWQPDPDDRPLALSFFLFSISSTAAASAYLTHLAIPRDKDWDVTKPTEGGHDRNGSRTMNRSLLHVGLQSAVDFQFYYYHRVRIDHHIDLIVLTNNISSITFPGIVYGLPGTSWETREIASVLRIVE
eukprot:gene13263-9106_t